ncbi:DUF4983 domain-containing protein [Pedobacter frigoris]|nr:DUF4983 domain-containing protein [Pedobacter frigoris]
MKKIMKSVFERKTLSITIILGLILVSSACNKSFDNVLPKSFKNDTLGVGDGSKRVLYIILDGVRGSVVKSLAPANLTQITSRSVYTYDGLADYQRNQITNAASWTTMLTGVDYTKHNVTNENFAGFDNQVTPTIFTRLKSVLAKARTISFASTAVFNDKLAADATVKQNLSNDAAVKSAVVTELTTNDPSFLVAQFNSAELAAGSNYTSANTAYTSAITTLDGYIGEILTALKARKTYAGENWLVVVSSNKGGGVSGGAAGSNIFFDESRNTFVAFYNPKFTSVVYSMPDLNGLPYSGSGPRFLSNSGGSGIAVQNNTSIGNFGSTGNFTMMFKIRDDNPGVNNYPMFVGKRNPANTGVGTGGWSFLLGGGSFQLDWNGSPRPGGVISTKDGKWHTMGFTIFNEGTTRRLALFADGVKQATVTIGANTDNNFPLRIGTDVNSSTNLLIREIAIFNVTMSDADMVSNMRRQLQPANPYYANLIGYWPGNESSGSTMFDISGKGNNFTYSSATQFANFSDISPNISPEISQAAFSAVPNGVDIPSMIYNWMNISIPEQWNLMGKFYNPTVALPKN